ncbi:AraC family transcriptional regulator [Paenibacillus sp. GYB004]|uniref:helix-turn-helix transcriptional regulator n=1 Tax=Paenibacillus sp. GYB004 TaxID=2994393 RepID=UPI002F967489
MHIREYDVFVTAKTAANINPAAGISVGERPNFHYNGAGVGGGIHPYHEVFYIHSGEVLVQWIGHTYHVHAPALFLLTPNSPHLFTRLSTQLHFWFVELEEEETDFVPGLETITRWNHMQSDPTQELSRWPLIVQTVQGLTTMIQTALTQKRPPVFERLLVCDIQKLLLLIEHGIRSEHPAGMLPANGARQAGHGDPAAKSVQYDAIYDLIRYMEGFYQTDITLALLAERSGLTASYIIRLFKERIGVTPIQYLLELRMHSATSYLQLTDMSVQDIAEASGFPSIHYFSRMFKQRFGVSPSDWKRKIRTAST